jgi:hypothetical protein
MKKWYFFTPTDNVSILNPNNYSLIPINPPKNGQDYKLYAIFADDRGNNTPLINELELNSDFVRSVQSNRNVGMVMLNKKFIIRKNWLNKFIDKLITYI